MLTRSTGFLALVLVWFGAVAGAQTPLSAIDWLSDSLSAPRLQTATIPRSDIAKNALPEDISVSDISGPSPDAIGLLPTSVTGLPRGLWGNSRSANLAGRLQAERVDIMPAMQDMIRTLLLAELDPPVDSGPDAKLFLARLDTLLAMGALEQAKSLLVLSGQNRPELFRRAFDVSLLLRVEDLGCATLRTTPSLSPTFPARVFCLARGGDWDAAALSLETGRALGFLDEFEDALLARFLDPMLFEGEPRLTVPERPSPLVFRLLEAIGEPIPTTGLPRAFAHADLHANTGWKAQIEAAERLVRTGAVDPNQLLGLYSERRPAASGGVWDRVKAIQKLDQALTAGDAQAVVAALPAAWREIEKAELEVPFARLFSRRLSQMTLPDDSRELVFEIGLLSDDYEVIAQDFTPTNDRQHLLKAIASGNPGPVFAADPITAALQDGFRADGVPIRLQSLTTNDRLGEAILRAIDLFQNGSHGDLDELSDALAFFRAVGLEDLARRAALQLLLLERRG